ncbi:unnamed protein product [Timema podura]|uniref:G-protein coupled receptors family 2 profile 2 domain-containing protein n=1 Tax=Timema podura TaxID=61482 RepID=A0ABN7NQN9_TIMPD|nr:unnamed protein product [Timema podura]
MFNEYDEKATALATVKLYQTELTRPRQSQRHVANDESDTAVHSSSGNNNFQINTYNIIIDRHMSALEHPIQAYFLILRSYCDVPAFKFVIGIPECGSRQQWPIYHYPGSQDRLSLLPNGRLRHYISHHESDDVGGTLPVEGKEEHQRYYYEYELGTYCLDKTEVVQDKKLEAQYAVVCAPEVTPNWNNTDYLIRRLVDPVLHGVAITCFTTVSIIYFVLPQLRDLVGNIISTITTCLVACQAADLVGIFVEYRNHVSFLIADTVKYVSLLAAFFWLNSMGYYIWKTFRSRNVFLRVTDGRKYCYYSLYAWGSTLTMTLVALFAHFFLDTGNPMSQPSSITQDNVGWLGIAMFFTPVGFTILVNIFFYLTTGQIINRMSTYGRIHHKMKYNFDMFVKLLPSDVSIVVVPPTILAQV